MLKYRHDAEKEVREHEKEDLRGRGRLMNCSCQQACYKTYLPADSYQSVHVNLPESSSSVVSGIATVSTETAFLTLAVVWRTSKIESENI